MRHIPRLITLVTLPVLAAACVPAEEEPETSPPPAEASCDADAGAAFIGEAYTAYLDQRLLQETGARILRVTHKDAPVTMDYRPDRLTVAYDDNTVIVSLSCG